MQKSTIEWLNIPGFQPRSWNVTRGCKEVSTECAQCYAKQFAERFRGVPGHAYEHGFDFRIAPYKLEEPLKVRRQCAVFVNSMTDLFYGGNKCDKGENPTELIRDICNIMLTANWHIYIILTKRAERMQQILNGSDATFRKAAEAPHIWWGVSAGNRKNGLPRIKVLQQTDVRTRCVSFEPLLEDLGKMDLTGIHWGKIGGESGNKGPRPMEKKWVKNIMRQLQTYDVARHFKQWGGKNKKKAGRILDGRLFDEYPAIADEVRGTPPLPRNERLQAIEEIRKLVREKWSNHPLLANLPAWAEEFCSENTELVQLKIKK